MLHKNFIGGEWSGETVSTNINPSNTNEIVGEYAATSTQDTLDAIAAAKEALPKWSRSPILERHGLLKKVADEILSRKEELGTLLARDLPTAGVDFHVPLGGRKSSSYGPREQGSYAAEFYTTVKTAYTSA